MKALFLILILVIWYPAIAQNRKQNFNSIDRYVLTVSASTPDLLACRLTESYHTEKEKARAIFSWIAQNIAYNTGIYRSVKNYAPKFSFDPLDTMTVWKSGDEMAAIRILHRRLAVCEGYAKLFKVLCDYAGLESEIVFGYVRNGRGKAVFRCNHAWNVVRIDSVWHPVDVTWGSGFISFSNEYVQQMDERYFLPDPADFIRDHYPEDLRWALLEQVPSIREFDLAPFRYKCFDKYLFTSIPKKGVIEIVEGDTVKLELNVRDAARDKQISSDPFFDSTIVEQSPHSAFLYPLYQNNKIIYSYHANDPTVEWLHLFYNNDLVLRYHLTYKNRPSREVK